MNQQRSCFHFSFLKLGNSTSFGKIIIINCKAAIWGFSSYYPLIHKQLTLLSTNTEHSNCPYTKPSARWLQLLRLRWNQVLFPSWAQDAPAWLHTPPAAPGNKHLSTPAPGSPKCHRQECWTRAKGPERFTAELLAFLQCWGIERSGRSLICAPRYQAQHSPTPAMPRDTPHTAQVLEQQLLQSTELQHWRFRKPHQTHSSAPRIAGRGLFSTACSRIHVPTWIPELEKIKHSYAYPSILNASSFPDYMFQMKATEGRKT